MGAYGLFPTGSYDSDQGVFNVGENRYSAALQLAFQRNLSESLVVVAAVDGVWFGSNDNFTSARLTLDQEALYTAQFGLTYQTTQVLSLSASYFFTWGGETAIDGVDQDNSNELHRYQLSAIAQLPVGRLILQYGGDLQARKRLLRRKARYRPLRAVILKLSRIGAQKCMWLRQQLAHRAAPRTSAVWAKQTSHTTLPSNSDP